MFVAIDRKTSQWTPETRAIVKDVQKLRNSSGLAEARTEVVKNIGADIGQFLQQILSRKPAVEYDILLKIHSKSDGVWLRSQIDGLCGSISKVEEIFLQFEDQAKLGMIGPPAMTWNTDTDPLAACCIEAKPDEIAQRDKIQLEFDQFCMCEHRPCIWLSCRYNDFLYPGEKWIQKTYHDIYPAETLVKEHYRVVVGSAYWSRYGPLVANEKLRAAASAWLEKMPGHYKAGSRADDDADRVLHSLERVLPTMVRAHYGLEVI